MLITVPLPLSVFNTSEKDEKWSLMLAAVIAQCSQLTHCRFGIHTNGGQQLGSHLMRHLSLILPCDLQLSLTKQVLISFNPSLLASNLGNEVFISFVVFIFLEGSQRGSGGNHGISLFKKGDLKKYKISSLALLDPPDKNLIKNCYL
jgi:hypothetical protein